LRDVASGHFQRAEVAEDSRSFELLEQGIRLGVQCHLPGGKLMITGRCLHDRPC
jgi:hypothetical protein